MIPIGQGSKVIEGPGPTTDLDKLITKLAPHPDAGKVTIKLTPDQEALYGSMDKQMKKLMS
jgi:hypothetical protein